jgi:AcrR family transcriptional regulator
MPTGAKRSYRRADETRRHVLSVAARLFYAEGIHAVGIDRIAAEANVTTTTLYRLFGSKDGLVAAYLRREDEIWFDWLERTASAGPLVNVVDRLDANARAGDYRGCPFRMALAEYPAPDSEVHQAAIQTKVRTLGQLRALAAEAGCTDPDGTAEQLMLIIEGIWATAVERGPDSPPSAGPALVRTILGAAAR